MMLMMPNSTLEKTITVQDLRIDEYLTKITEVFERILKEDSSGPSQTLLSFKTRMQTWLQRTKGLMQRKKEQSKNGSWEGTDKADITKDVENTHKAELDSCTTGPVSTDAASVASMINTTGLTGSMVPVAQTVAHMPPHTANDFDMYATGTLGPQNPQDRSQGGNPSLDPILNAPFSMNDFSFSSAFPMADFMFGGMEGLTGGFMFDFGGGAGGERMADGVGDVQSYGFQGENVNFGYSDARA